MRIRKLTLYALSRCFKPLSSACERLLFILREINRFLEVLFEFAYSKTPCFSILETRYSILDPRFSRLETRTSRHSRRENRVSRIESRLSTYIWPVLNIPLISQSYRKVWLCMLSGLGETLSQLFFALWQEMVSSVVVRLVIKFTPGKAETLCCVVTVKRKVPIFFSQTTPDQ